MIANHNYTEIHEQVRAIIENDKLSVYEKAMLIEAKYIIPLLDECDELQKELNK